MGLEHFFETKEVFVLEMQEVHQSMDRNEGAIRVRL